MSARLVQGFIWIGVVFLICFSSCSSRKNVTSSAAKIEYIMSSLKSKKLNRFIKEWTGVPYQLGGLSKRGIDCSGFALLLERDIYGERLPRRSIEQADVIIEKKISKLKEGDLIFFSFGAKVIDHVGVYLKDGYFVHASTQKGVIVDDLSLAIYQKSIVKAGAIK